MNMLGLVMCLSGITCHVVHKFSLSKHIPTQIISDGGVSIATSCEPTAIQVNYVNGNANKQSMKLNYFSNQNTPLLDSDDALHSESDDSHENASEVILDILKRRDIHRWSGHCASEMPYSLTHTDIQKINLKIYIFIWYKHFEGEWSADIQKKIKWFLSR